MTKEQFLSGVSFRVKGTTYRGDGTFKYEECILKETRSSIDEKVLYTAYHCNIIRLGRLGFEGFVFIMNKKVLVKHKFEDLVIYEEEA